MKRCGRIALIAMALAGVYLLLNGIGWASVFFWKSELVVWCVAVPSFVLCPLSVIEVVPGCALDTPLFFIPMMGICFLFWAWGIEVVWNKKKKCTESATAPSSEPAAQPPQGLAAPLGVMIIAIHEDGEVRIFETEEDVQLEWGPYPRDVESEEVIFYAQDGSWMKPIFTEEGKRWFGLRRHPVTFRLARSPGMQYEDPIGLALRSATALVPNKHFGSLAEMKAKYPFDRVPFEKTNQ